MSRFRSLWLGCVLLLSAASGRARADGEAVQAEVSDAHKAEYEELTKKGIREYELNHWAEAKTYFTRAHTLFPNARTLRALGLIAFEMRDYVESLGLLERALADKRKPLAGTMRQEVSDLADDARSFVGRVSLVLEPANASVFIDDEPVKLREQGSLLLDPGEHELRVEAAGYRSQSRSLRAPAGQAIELKLALVAANGGAPGSGAELAVAATPATDAATGASWWSTQRIVAVGLGAGAVVAFGIGTTSGLLALSAKSDSDHNCDGERCDPKGAAARDTAVARADIASVAFIAGGALITAGAITFFLAPDPERPVSGQLSLRPGPGLAGIAVLGRF
jgi:hypothetical protein